MCACVRANAQYRRVKQVKQDMQTDIIRLLKHTHIRARAHTHTHTKVKCDSSHVAIRKAPDRCFGGKIIVMDIKIYKKHKYYNETSFGDSIIKYDDGHKLALVLVNLARL